MLSRICPFVGFKRLGSARCANLSFYPVCGLAATRANSASSRATKFVKSLRSNPRLARRVALRLDPETLARMENVAVEADNPELEDEVKSVPMSQLGHHAFKTSLPYFGIGFFNNAVMIVVAYFFDVTLGVTLGFPTLAAAGIGLAAVQTCGVKLRRNLERFCRTLSWDEAPLTRAQERLYHVKEISKFAKIFGMVFGCLIGVTPAFLVWQKNPRMMEALSEFLPPSKKGELLAAMTTVVFDKGDEIVKLGELSEYLYLITCGEVEVFDMEDDEINFLGSLQSGSVFGELGFLLDDPSPVKVFASTALRTKRLSREDFYDVLGEDGQAFLQKVADRNQTLPNFVRESLKYEFSPKSPRRRTFASSVERVIARLAKPEWTLPMVD